MDATTMPSTTLPVTKLQSDFPAFTFTAGDEFRWSPSDKTVFYDPASDDDASLLHEVSHAVLAHAQYSKDIELIEMERDAWEYAKTVLSPMYNIIIDEDIVQDSLDTYRDWLHARSTCPNCEATGIQTKKRQYKCITCTTQWRVNEARVCALRRYRI